MSFHRPVHSTGGWVNYLGFLLVFSVPLEPFMRWANQVFSHMLLILLRAYCEHGAWPGFFLLDGYELYKGSDFHFRRPSFSLFRRQFAILLICLANGWATVVSRLCLGLAE